MTVVAFGLRADRNIIAFFKLGGFRQLRWPSHFGCMYPNPLSSHPRCDNHRGAGMPRRLGELDRMPRWCLFTLYVIARFVSPTRAFVCASNPIRVTKGHALIQGVTPDKFKCSTLAMAFRTGTSSEGEQQQMQAGRTGGMLSTASLERAIDGLTESEKYNAVLQGVSSILMGKKQEGAAAKGAFQEVFQLLDEMDANRIKCTIRTASAVVDAAAATTNIGIITQVFSKIRRAGVGQKFSRDLGRLSLLPTEASQKQKALRDLVPVPDDDRAQEIGYAASFMVLIGSDFSWEGVGQVMHYDTTIPTVIGTVTAAAVALDVWKRSGCTSKMVLNGMNRLFLKDVERESRAEAGAFLAGYVTGLPCFAFQPSAMEAVRMAADPELKDSLLSGNGIHRILVWLLAGVAGEGLVHRQMIASDPRQAYAFLQMVRNRETGCDLDPEDDHDRVQWAFNEARVLLKDNERAFEALRQRLESGGATVGDCVAVIERRTT